MAKALTSAKRNELIGVGKRMADWLYHIKQARDLPPWVRVRAAELQAEWDAVIDRKPTQRRRVRA